MEEIKRLYDRVQTRVGQEIVGGERVIRLSVIALLVGGHMLIDDVPGTGKTTFAKAFAASLSLEMRRLQCTPDLLPSDMTGVNYFDMKNSEFRFIPGPAFTNLLLADEIYERIVFDGCENVSMAAYEDVAERVITVNGFSKSVAMTGWRAGYLACDVKLQKVMYNLFQHTMTCVSGFIQKACVTALDCEKEIEEMRLRYEQRRDMFITALNAIPGVSCRMPQGAFYAWVKFDVPGMDSEAVCAYMLEKAKVVGVPGVAYGTDECCVRFSFAANDEDLAEAARRIRIAMEELVK